MCSSVSRYSDFTLLNKSITNDLPDPSAALWSVHSLPCVPYPREMGKGTWRFGATLCFSLSQGTHSPAERLLSSRELMQEKRWSQPPSAVQIPCSKGFNSVLTLDAVQSLGCWCHVRFTLHCLPPLWNSWGPANSFCGFHCSNVPV